MFKNIPLGKNESRHLQFRAESYNTFNHTQFTSVSTGANFKGSGGSTLSSPQLPFGQFTAAAPARIMALAIKVYF